LDSVHSDPVASFYAAKWRIISAKNSKVQSGKSNWLIDLQPLLTIRWAPIISHKETRSYQSTVRPISKPIP